MPEIWFPNLGIKINHLSRTAFSIGNFSVYWYGLIIGLAIIGAFLMVLHEAKRSGQSQDFYIDFASFAIILSVLGARAYYVIFSWDMYKDNLIKIFAFREGGLAIYGAIITGILCGIIYSKKHKTNTALMADTVLPSVLFGQICGRWGNFFNCEAFGGYTDGLFAMRILKSKASYLPQSALENLVVVNSVEYIQVQPTFFYESSLNLILLIFLLILRPRKKFHGQIGLLYVIGYGVIRFFVESFRTDQLTIGNTGIAISQIVAILMIAIGAILYIYLKKKGKEEASV